MAYNSDDWVPSVIREAGRAVADRLLPENQRRYDRDDRPQRPDYGPYRDRGRSLSPRSTSGSSMSRGGSERGYRRYEDDSRAFARNPHARERWESREGDRRPRYRGESVASRRSPSPDRYRFRPEPRRGEPRRGRGYGRGRAPQRGPPGRDVHTPYVNPNGWRRTVFPPKAMEADRDTSGHPIFPSDLAAEDDKIHGKYIGMLPPTEMPGNEEERRAKAIAEEEAGLRRYDKMNSRLTIENSGIWATAGRVLTFGQAVNVIRWVTRGDKHAREYLRSVVTRLGTDPTILRTTGEVALLQHQNRAMGMYDAVVYGTKIVRSRPANHGRIGAPFGAGPSRAPTPPPSPSPGPPSPRPPQKVCLGNARPQFVDISRIHLEEEPTSSSVPRNVSRTLDEAIQWYGSVPTVHWPKGMRVSIDSLPTTERAHPWPADVAAWFTLNALAPERDIDPSSLHRANFIKMAVQLLSVKGVFDLYVAEGGYILDTLAVEHFPFNGTNLSFAKVIVWLVQHGINVGSGALVALEDFARARRNHLAGAEDINAPSFEEGFPHNAADIEQIQVHDEDKWADLRFGPTREGVTSTYPEFPAGEIRSQHAPDTRMDTSAG
ncbi:hypothetical protein DFH06DRAFT_1154128 [Mycena polygramma]|nr:hypothetical protein DFH06DRAFT_1154128 [Mycena polygramma]